MDDHSTMTSGRMMGDRGDTSYHHLYYSAHADPVAELEALTQSSLKLEATVTSSCGAQHAVTDSR